MQGCEEVVGSVDDSSKLPIHKANASGSSEKDTASAVIVKEDKCSNPLSSIDAISDDDIPLSHRLEQLNQPNIKQESVKADDSCAPSPPPSKKRRRGRASKSSTDVEFNSDSWASTPRRYKKRSYCKSSTNSSNKVESNGDDDRDEDDEEDHEDLISKSNLYYNVRHSYYCTLCKSSAGEKTLIIRHLLSVHARCRSHECLHCERTYANEAALKNHVKRHHSDVMNVEEMVKCTKCGYQCTDDELIKFHVLRKHAVLYSHVCDCCGKCFKTRKARYAHEAKTKRYNKYIHKMKRARDKKYVCYKCKAVASSKMELTKHENSHNSVDGIGDLYPCQHCDVVFLKDKLLREHIPQHERDGSGYSCSVCSKRISSREHMRKHERVHTGERPYSCPECGRTFALQNTMKVHALSHKGIKPYVCDLCDVAYSQRSALMTHWKGKHAALPPPPPVEISRFFDYHGRVLDNPY